MDRVIDTDRLSLRPLNKSDLEALHALWTAAGVRRYLAGMQFARRATIGGLDTLFYLADRRWCASPFAATRTAGPHASQ